MIQPPSPSLHFMCFYDIRATKYIKFRIIYLNIIGYRIIIKVVGENVFPLELPMRIEIVWKRCYITVEKHQWCSGEQDNSETEGCCVDFSAGRKDVSPPPPCVMRHAERERW